MGLRGLDLAARYARLAATGYGYHIDQLSHALQCAALASAVTADQELVLAALLHDVGHLLLGDTALLPERADLHHGRAGAMLLRPFTSSRVAWLVEFHVDTRLCFGGDVEPRLSPEQHAWIPDALRLREWDALAIDPAAGPPPLIAYRELLEEPFGPQSWSDLPGIGTLVHREFTTP